MNYLGVLFCTLVGLAQVELSQNDCVCSVTGNGYPIPDDSYLGSSGRFGSSGTRTNDYPEPPKTPDGLSSKTFFGSTENTNPLDQPYDNRPCFPLPNSQNIPSNRGQTIKLLQPPQGRSEWKHNVKGRVQVGDGTRPGSMPGPGSYPCGKTTTNTGTSSGGNFKPSPGASSGANMIPNRGISPGGNFKPSLGASSGGNMIPNIGMSSGGNFMQGAGSGGMPVQPVYVLVFPSAPETKPPTQQVCGQNLYAKNTNIGHFVGLELSASQMRFLGKAAAIRRFIFKWEQGRVTVTFYTYTNRIVPVDEKILKRIYEYIEYLERGVLQPLKCPVRKFMGRVFGSSNSVMEDDSEKPALFYGDRWVTRKDRRGRDAFQNEVILGDHKMVIRVRMKWTGTTLTVTYYGSMAVRNDIAFLKKMWQVGNYTIDDVNAKVFTHLLGDRYLAF